MIFVEECTNIEYFVEYKWNLSRNTKAFIEKKFFNSKKYFLCAHV
jgi:hypothetical protein